MSYLLFGYVWYACVCSTVAYCLDTCLVTAIIQAGNARAQYMHGQTDRHINMVYMILHTMEWCTFLFYAIPTCRKLSHNNLAVVPSAFLFGTKLTTL